MDGAFAGTDATFGPGHSLEFVATFGAATFQHVAFTDNFNSAWAMFSTRGRPASSTPAPTPAAVPPTPRSGAWPYVGSPHVYRIEWDAGQVQYFVDGNLVAHRQRQLRPEPERAPPATSTPAAPSLSVDWLHLSPYPASGTFLSRVFDAGQAADWGALSWNANAPPNTSVQISVRTGNTPDPRRDLDRLHPDRQQRRRHPRQLPLRPVPGRAWVERSEPDADPERRLDRLHDGGRHDCADDHAEDAGAERHRTSHATRTSTSSSARR